MNQNIKLFIARYATILFLIVIMAATAVLSPNFLTVQNFMNILRQSCVLSLVALGMGFVIIAGHMDLSVGSIVSLTGVCAILMSTIFPAGIAILLTLLTAGVLGAVNGLIVVKCHANNGESLMITFGTQLVFAAASLLCTGGFTLQGSSSTFYNAIGAGSLGRYLPVPVLIVAAFTAVLYILDKKTVFGRAIHMIGYNEECSRLSGISVGRIKILCYVLSGFMAGMAGIMLSSRTVSATPTAGAGLEMEAIIAVVLGGISLSGGKGNAVKAFLGVLMLGVIGNSMNLLGFSAFDQFSVKGLILILTIAFEVWSSQKIQEGERQWVK